MSEPKLCLEEYLDCEGMIDRCRRASGHAGPHSHLTDEEAARLGTPWSSPAPRDPIFDIDDRVARIEKRLADQRAAATNKGAPVVVMLEAGELDLLLGIARRTLDSVKRRLGG